MKYAMFIVSEDTTICFRGIDYKTVKDFLDIMKKQHISKCVDEIISQVESCVNDEWDEETGFMSVDVGVDDTKFSVHIAEC